MNYTELENDVGLLKFQMYTGYAPNKDKALTLNRQLLPYAGVNTGVTYGQWAGLVFGMSYSFFWYEFQNFHNLKLLLL